MKNQFIKTTNGRAIFLNQIAIIQTKRIDKKGFIEFVLPSGFASNLQLEDATNPEEFLSDMLAAIATGKSFRVAINEETQKDIIEPLDCQLKVNAPLKTP